MNLYYDLLLSLSALNQGRFSMCKIYFAFSYPDNCSVVDIFLGYLLAKLQHRCLNVNFFNVRILDMVTTQVMLDRDTGRSRGFGFVTFSDQRAMESAISDMHGRELRGRVISVNKAEPKLNSSDGPGNGYRGSGSGSRGGYRGNSGGADRFSSRPRFSAGGGGGGGGNRGDRFGGSDRYDSHHVDDRYDGGSRYDKYSGSSGGGRDHYGNSRHPTAGDRYHGDRYGSTDYPVNGGYGKERGYERDGGGGSDRYLGGGGGGRYDGGGGSGVGGAGRYEGGGGGAGRYEGGGGGGGGGGYRERPGSYGGRSGRGGGGFKDRSGPYDRPHGRGMGRPSGYEDRY